MIMDLPKKFYFYDYARVDDYNLYIYRLERFEDLMYELAYATRKRRCVYCGKKLKMTNSTMDHRYPRDTGGVSIVNNLYPTCPLCNSHKSNYLHQEFIKLSTLSKQEKKKEEEGQGKAGSREHCAPVQLRCSVLGRWVLHSFLAWLALNWLSADIEE